MELLKDYDFNLQYHFGKENVVADALSRRPRRIIASLLIKEWQALETLTEFDIQAATTDEGRPFGCLRVQPTLINRILEAQEKDEGLKKWFEKASTKDPTEWFIGTDAGLRCRN